MTFSSVSIIDLNTFDSRRNTFDSRRLEAMSVFAPLYTLMEQDLTFYQGYYWRVRVLENETHLLQCHGTRKCRNCEFSIPITPSLHQSTHITESGETHLLWNTPCMATQLISKSNNPLLDSTYHSHESPNLNPGDLFQTIDVYTPAYHQSVLNSLFKIDSRGSNLGHVNYLRKKKFQHLHGHPPSSAALLMDPTFLSNIGFKCDHMTSSNGVFVSCLSHPAFYKAHDNLRSCSSIFSDTIHNVFTEKDGRSYHLHCDHTYNFETSHGQPLSASLITDMSAMEYLEHYLHFHRKFRHFDVSSTGPDFTISPSEFWYTTASGLSYMMSQIDSHLFSTPIVPTTTKDDGIEMDVTATDDIQLATGNISARCSFQLSTDTDFVPAFFLNITLPEVSIGHSIIMDDTIFVPVAFIGFQSSSHIVGIFKFPNETWQYCNDLSASTFSPFTDTSFQCVNSDMIVLYMNQAHDTTEIFDQSVISLPQLPWENNSCWATQTLTLLNMMNAYQLPVCLDSNEKINRDLTTWKTSFSTFDNQKIMSARNSLLHQFSDSENGMGSTAHCIRTWKDVLIMPLFDASSEIDCPGCHQKYIHPMPGNILPRCDNTDLSLSCDTNVIVNCPNPDCSHHRIPFSMLGDTIFFHDVSSSLLNKKSKKTIRDCLEISNVPVSFLRDDIQQLALAFHLDTPVEIGGMKTIIFMESKNGLAQRFVSRTYLGNVKSCFMFNDINLIKVSMKNIPKKYFASLTSKYLPQFSTSGLKSLILSKIHNQYTDNSIPEMPKQSTKNGSNDVTYDSVDQILTFPKYQVSVKVPVSLIMSDFSVAQINGHALAIAYIVQEQMPFAGDKHVRTKRNINQIALDIAVEIVSSFFKGCGYHFKLNMAAFARTLKDMDSRDQFHQLVNELRYKTMAIPQFKKKLVSLTTEFPECAPIMEWWTRSIVGKMAFASLSTLQHSFHKSENTNNPIESNFRLYRLLGLRKKTLGEGLVILSMGYDFSLHHMETSRISYQYGERSNTLLPSNLMIPKHLPKKKTVRSIPSMVDDTETGVPGIPFTDSIRAKRRRDPKSNIANYDSQRRTRVYCRCKTLTLSGICDKNRCSCRKNGTFCNNKCHCSKVQLSSCNNSDTITTLSNPMSDTMSNLFHSDSESSSMSELDF